MNSSTWAWIIVAIVVIAGLWYFLSQPASPAASGTASTTQEGSTGNQGGSTGGVTQPGSSAGSGATTIGFGSIDDLIAMNKPLICSVDMTAGGGRRDGTVYVANGQMRGDFVSTTGGVADVISMIDTGSELYLWNSQNSAGLKLPANAAGGSSVATHGGIDPNVDGSYACHAWSADPAFFVPPSTISYATS